MQLAAWIEKHITDNAARNPLSYTLSPERAWATHRADARNRGLLFVAVCRAQGIPARIDEVTGRVQFVATNGTMPTEQTAQWQTVKFGVEAEQTPQSAQATLKLSYTPRRYMENPTYYTHFTLSRMDEGMPSLLNYPEGHTWQSAFAPGTSVAPGNYLLTSGTRMADGAVLAQLQVFSVGKGGHTEQLVMREDKQGVQVIGNFNAENRYFDVKAGAVKSILSTTGRGYYVTGLIRANHEPTNHILHDIEKMRSELEARAVPLCCSSLHRTSTTASRRTVPNLPTCPRRSVSASTLKDRCKPIFSAAASTQSKELPLVVIADTFNRVVFSSQGYTIGLGERIQQTVGKLN